MPFYDSISAILSFKLQKGIELVKQVYIITNEGKLSKDFGLKDQLRRASVSIPTNVAE
ncbi:MAG: four helix bundle protein, partial [Pleurocapsa sp. SU_5_0]|nr:four helix bundle protein [Pleurocapsa sp. SU_5_0]